MATARTGAAATASARPSASCGAPRGRSRSAKSAPRSVEGAVRGGRLGVRCGAAPAEVAAATTPETISPLPFRVGHGFDLHRLEEGVGRLIIGGVDIPHTKGCAAHSDGDVLLHTVTDAILGALCLPDIGQLFPDNDPKWHGQSSDVFLTEAVRRMGDMGYVLGNLDATIILQRPKVRCRGRCCAAPGRVCVCVCVCVCGVPPGPRRSPPPEDVITHI